MLPYFEIFHLPIFAWLGIILALLVILQISVAKKFIPLNFDLWHRRVIPFLIIIVLIFHAWYGIQLFWPR